MRADHVWIDLVGRMRSARSSAERRDLVRATAVAAGVSEATVYRRLQEHGYDSGRATRKDAGVSQVRPDELVRVAEVMAVGRNKRGQLNTPLKEALGICQEQGLVQPEVSYGQVARLMRHAGLGVAHLRAPEAAIARVSRHPNHVWLFDISVAIQWYFKDAATGKKLDLYNDAGARFYEGKRQNLAALTRVIHRFTLVDHYSGAYYVRYYYSAGEAALDVVDFLQRAMAPKAGDRNPLHGIPRRMVLDLGSANRSAEVQNLLTDLGVTFEYHAKGNPKASGAVEQRHYRWQTQFEGRLAAQPAPDLDTLNGWAEGMGARYNAERAHTRHGRPPAEMWLTIAPEQLREPPERAAFFELASAKTRTATLSNQLWLRADSRKWVVTGENVYPGQKVQFRRNAFLESGIRVWDLEGRELAAVPLTFDAAGFPEQGPRHVWDDAEARGASLPPTPAQRIAQAATVAPVRLEGLFTGLDELEAQDIVARRRGTPFAAPPRAVELDDVLAREEAGRLLDRRLTPAEATWWKERAAGGLTRADFDALFDAFRRGAAAEATR